MDTEQEPRASSQVSGIISEIFSFLWEALKLVVISLVIIVPIRYYLIQPFFVDGQSMEPNFHDKDYLLVDKLGYRIGQPQRGDVIVFKFPNNPKEYFIKRIIGLPGETIEIRDNKVVIYNIDNPEGFTLDERSYLSENVPTTGRMRMTLDGDEFFVIGDNRTASSDSRSWGGLKYSFVSGRGWFRLWPLSAQHFLSRVEYPGEN